MTALMGTNDQSPTAGARTSSKYTHTRSLLISMIILSSLVNEVTTKEVLKSVLKLVSYEYAYGWRLSPERFALSGHSLAAVLP